MAELLGGAAIGALMGETVKHAVQEIKNGRKFGPTLKTSEQTLNALAPLVEQIKVSNDSLGRPREDIQKLETHIGELKELVEKCKKLTRGNVLSFSRYQAKLKRKFEALEIHLSFIVQLENKIDLGKLLVMQKEISENMVRKNEILGQFNGNEIRGWCGAPDEPQCIGMDEPLSKLKKQLMKGGVSVLVLAGLGGSGKTNIAKKLCWDPQIKDKFRGNIFYVTVSKTHNLKNIVRTLFQHCQHGAPMFQSDEDAINRLGLLLKHVGTDSEGHVVPILLVLDDVWPESEELVEKFKFQMSDYKILVTSRVAFRRFGTPFKLDPLVHDHAVSLFQHYAQLNESSSYKPDRDLLDEIVKGCKGSPLALQVTAGSLCQQPFEKWQTMMERLKSQTILESNSTNLLSRLQQSLDILEDIKEKECFVDLGLFPEDQMIPVTVLIDMWATLYNLDEDGIQAMAIVHNLNTRNLISIISTRKVATEADMYYNNHYVVIHDLLRELANHQRKEESFDQRKRLIIDLHGDDRPDWWIGPNQHGMSSCMPSSVTRMWVKQKKVKVAAGILSISADETFSSGWCDMRPDEAKVLILNLRSDKYSLPDFTKKMSKLEVLIVTNYGFHCSELTKLELLGFLSNLKRIRLEKVSVEGLCKLNNLRKLSLHMCSTRNAFESCSIKISDAMPNLVELSIDYCKDLIKLPDGLCNITTLKKLSITNCHNLSAMPQDIKNLENLEVLRLCSCSDLKEMPESVEGLNKLRCLDISDCASLPKLPDDIGKLQKLEKLAMKGCSKLSELPNSVIKIGNLKHEMHVICDEEHVILWEHYRNIPYLSIDMHKEDINLNWLHRTRS
ncbi:probable disease resistance protein At5g66900 [Trifolium pratense]|uniref:probable disease resistance protein At5g66900 n=1 Tax=Trifolium pratense TaxID=57577 RepID=UPI001E697457|nr:probable disease resistance protein At5g66900 [Trifolium pratense]